MPRVQAQNLEHSLLNILRHTVQRCRIYGVLTYWGLCVANDSPPTTIASEDRARGPRGGLWPATWSPIVGANVHRNQRQSNNATRVRRLLDLKE